MEYQEARADLSTRYGDVPAMQLVEDVARGDADPAHVLSALVLLRQLRARLGELEPRLIAAARDQGVSWARLAPALGVASRQAAERRYLRLRPDDEHATGEERVRAERDRRAGDRAVTAWAARNSAVLRGLAGQVAGLPQLTGDARRTADNVHTALGGDHASDLLAPLHDAATHLRDAHPALADRIDAVTAETTRLRDASRDR